MLRTSLLKLHHQPAKVVTGGGVCLSAGVAGFVVGGTQTFTPVSRALSEGATSDDFVKRVQRAEKERVQSEEQEKLREIKDEAQRKQAITSYWKKQLDEHKAIGSQRES